MLKKHLATVIRLVMATFCVSLASSSALAEIQLEWNFDHGALNESTTSISDTVVELGARTDIYASRWIYVKATGVMGLNPEFRVSNATIAGSSLSSAHRYVYSYDQENWHFFDNGENSGGYYRFSNDAAFTADVIWLAYALPYPWEATEQHMDKVAASPWVSPSPSADANFVLGLSNDGTLTDLGRAVPQLPIYGYLISDPSPGPREVVVITTGNHPNETTGSYTFEGVIDFILSDDPRAVTMRQLADFYVYPSCNPDGRWAGHARTSVENPFIDHNRDWDDPVLFTELQILTAAMKADTNSQVDWFFDFHSFNNPYSIGCWIYAEDADTAFVLGLQSYEPTMDIMFGSSPPDSPGVARHWAHSAAGLNAPHTFTPESGFIPGWQPSRYELQGKNYALALYEALVANADCGAPDPNGVEIFADNFDDGLAAMDWALFTSSSDYTADFAFDYSVDGIPPAPATSGSTTVGVKFTVNNNDGDEGAEAVSAYPLDLFVMDDFKLSFDVWLNYNGGSCGGTGSTEFMTAGVDHAGGQVNWALNSASDGVWFAMTGEGGASQDYRAYDGTSQFDVAAGVYPAGSQNHTASLYQNLFPDPPFETPGAPGKQWVSVEIVQTVDQIEWLVDGVSLAVVDAPAAAFGNVMIGYMDVFASLAIPAADNFVIFDNVVVEQLPESDCNGNGLRDACEVIQPGDFDGDGDVDGDDFAAFEEVVASPGSPIMPWQATCVQVYLDVFDGDGDADVDLADFGTLQVLFGE